MTTRKSCCNQARRKVLLQVFFHLFKQSKSETTISIEKLSLPSKFDETRSPIRNQKHSSDDLNNTLIRQTRNGPVLFYLPPKLANIAHGVWRSAPIFVALLCVLPCVRSVPGFEEARFKLVMAPLFFDPVGNPHDVARKEVDQEQTIHCCWLM